MTNTLTTLTTADRPAPVDDLDRVLQAFRALQTQHARVLTHQSVLRGLHATDLRFLVFVAGADAGVTPKHASDHLELTTGAMTSLIDRLEQRGHIERRPNPGDRRSILVHLTPSGVAVAGEVAALYREAFRSGVDPADLARVAAALEAVGSALDRRR
ncbi:MarR family transcriptional regulator [Curtobacterium sp. Csp1]|uniref:MarR family winged helix-turn-helix transcriptional regulator n=1 Tax=unclassified Curtobacterium TaxID=257496 RepID=UPI001599639C|nr:MULTISPECIES: MarR family transcriptional regulator [unclassified Curtobacterium]QKS12413.1 MarR family transcriptional regulator [Curtobacterium sp. csp3]QKS19997.1 MarR family transcriptional regulator [Curtobacterium sp. Csp1]